MTNIKKNSIFGKLLTILLAVALSMSMTVSAFGETVNGYETYLPEETIVTPPIDIAPKLLTMPKRPTVQAKSAIVYCADTGQILYSKNRNTVQYPYSMTKLLTALVAVENNPDLEKVVTLTYYKPEKDETLVGFRTGEQVRIIDLLHAALIPSGNDAAYHLAIATSGSVKKFAALMNQKAKEIGATRSNFVNASGMHKKAHYSTAYDIMLITKAALSNPTIRQIAGKEKYYMPKTNKHKKRKIYTTDSFLVKDSYKKYGVFGGKTGTWSWGKCCLTTGAFIDGHTYYTVVMGTSIPERYNDTVKILKYGYKKVAYNEQQMELQQAE